MRTFCFPPPPDRYGARLLDDKVEIINLIGTATSDEAPWVQLVAVNAANAGLYAVTEGLIRPPLSVPYRWTLIPVAPSSLLTPGGRRKSKPMLASNHVAEQIVEFGQACASSARHCRCRLRIEIHIHAFRGILKSVRYRVINKQRGKVHTEYLEPMEFFAGPLVAKVEIFDRMMRSFGVDK